MTAGEHYHLKVCILAFIYNLHRSAYCMLWAFIVFYFGPSSHPPFSKLSWCFGFLSLLGEMSAWLAFDLEKHLEVLPPGRDSGEESGC